MSVEIREVPLNGNLRPFLDVVDEIYRADPHYVRPLDLMVKDRLSPKSPFFQHADGTLLLAYRHGRCIGRSTAHIDHEHLAKHRDDTGFFGFFDTENDPEIARALLDHASRWLSDRGMKRIRGPLSLSMNDEVGCL